MLFVSFTKGPGGFPDVFIITTYVTTLVPIYGTTLVDNRVFVLGGDQEVLDGTAIFEVGLNAISTTDLFDTFTKTLCVGMTMWPLVLTSLVTTWAPVVPCLLAPSMTSLVDLLSLFSTLSKAHLGYLHLVRAFLRWSFSCWSISGLLHTVFLPYGRGCG